MIEDQAIMVTKIITGWKIMATTLVILKSHDKASYLATILAKFIRERI